MPTSTNPSGTASIQDLRSPVLEDYTVLNNQSIVFIFPGVPENTTALDGDWTNINWVTGAGYAAGAACSVAGKGLAYLSILDAAGNPITGFDKQSCIIAANDPSAITLFVEFPTGLPKSGEYDVELYVDTTASTTLPATQLFRKIWTGSVIVKPTIESF